MQIKKLAVAAGAVGALSLSLVTAAPAFADYAPSAKDAVGVGSDTLMFAGDFIADGDHLGDAGYNTGGNVNKIVNFDAIPDANARLAYGSGGAVGLSSTFGVCAPGTGAYKGTGNATANHTADGVCQLNPTIVLRAGLRPVQRPNGSGDGAAALAKDILAGKHNIDYARASSSQASAFVAGTVSSITIGSENLGMIYSTTPATNAPAAGLSIAQLDAIYTANIAPAVNALGGTGCVTWNEVGGTSTDTIIALTPQQGSGTRKSFLTAIGSGTLAVPGSCAKDVEENDPEALNASGNAADAIEPMSQARLNMFLGLNGNGNNNLTNTGTTAGLRYFQDPSCKFGDNSVTTTGGTGAGLGAAGACGVATVAGTLGTPAVLTPAVSMNLTVGTTLGTGAGANWFINRNLYVYFKVADMNAVGKQFQAGVNQNLVRTLFANPCSGKDYNGVTLDPAVTTGPDACSTINGQTYGPGGLPFYADTAGQALISAAGITANYVYSATPA